MKITIATLAAATTLTCFATGLPAVQIDQAKPIYTYATYFHCNTATVGEADEAFAAVYQSVLDSLVAEKTAESWGWWLAHNTGGKWSRAVYLTGSSTKAVMNADRLLEIKSDHPPRKSNFTLSCSSSEDYIWHALAGREASGPRGKFMLSTYYVCDQSRESQADALMRRVFATTYNDLVDAGKLTSWGWAGQIAGGKYRRLLTMTASTLEALGEPREAIVAAAEQDPLNQTFTSICGSHQDYIWEVKDTRP